MADSPQASDPTSTPQQTPTADPPADDAEVKFWKRLEETIDKRIDEGVKRHLPGRTGPGTQRTGRTTFRDMLAEFMGGPFTTPKQD